ncbi:MAG: undecaprenyl/decaprenyl-phosphate alpha-N-acetylglucosaminyl 1-phosphate transferase [Lentisphaeria bacterium]|nr:undecaprenyl/decaprenyl-phosphate alpha-N-acetylglucosaminyl 1-phosphate transferase [Lentisphaeria bacterium]
MNWIQVYGAVFIMALFLALGLTPVCQKIARKKGFLDIPKNEQHKLHAGATPLLGGAAMFSAWVLTLSACFCALALFPGESFLQSMADEISGISNVVWQLVSIILCACAAVIMGTWDDKFALSARTKLIGQILIALVTVIFGGVRLSLFIDIPLISWAISAFWIVFLFNAINFCDNMDGLACGISAIAFCFFTAAAIVNQQYFVACLGACSAGAAIGFWFFNHSPASIFMGDGGSHFLAYLLAVISAKVTYYNPAVSASKLTILIPLFILAVPIFDTFAVVVIRLLNKKPIYIGDHNHISHRFMHMGMTRKRSVLLVHLLCLIFGLGALPLLWGDERSCFVLLIQGVVILLLMTILQYSGKLITEEKK